MKLFLGIAAAATLCFAAVESRVSRATITAVETSVNQSLAPRGTDPYYQLGYARGTYLEGYGALFTVELDLVNAGAFNLSPFKTTITKEEIDNTHERKLKKLASLREDMREDLVNASATLEGLPPNERVAMEAILFSYSWEDSKGIPHRVFMSAPKQKLLDARTSHASPAELAAIVEDREQ